MPSVKTGEKERCLRDSILSVLSFFLYAATTKVKEGEFNWKSKEVEQRKKKEKRYYLRAEIHVLKWNVLVPPIKKKKYHVVSLPFFFILLRVA